MNKSIWLLVLGLVICLFLLAVLVKAKSERFLIASKKDMDGIYKVMVQRPQVMQGPQELQGPQGPQIPSSEPFYLPNMNDILPVSQCGTDSNCIKGFTECETSYPYQVISTGDVNTNSREGGSIFNGANQFICKSKYFVDRYNIPESCTSNNDCMESVSKCTNIEEVSTAMELRFKDEGLWKVPFKFSPPKSVDELSSCIPVAVMNGLIKKEPFTSQNGYSQELQEYKPPVYDETNMQCVIWSVPPSVKIPYVDKENWFGEDRKYEAEAFMAILRPKQRSLSTEDSIRNLREVMFNFRKTSNGRYPMSLDEIIAMQQKGTAFRSRDFEIIECMQINRELGSSFKKTIGIVWVSQYRQQETSLNFNSDYYNNQPVFSISSVRNDSSTFLGNAILLKTSELDPKKRR